MSQSARNESGNLDLKLAVSRLLNWNGKHEAAIELDKYVYEKATIEKQKIQALIGYIHEAYNLNKTDLLYFLLSESKKLTHPDITYVQALYVDTTEEIATLFNLTSFQLLELAHRQGSDRASLMLAEYYTDTGKSLSIIRATLSSLLERQNPDAVYYMVEAVAARGESKEVCRSSRAAG